ncbi:hypothetical protein NBRC116601_03870 [Cognatishimia sp. WU-CL00825]|uniref:hypothetical protein n=1 Tax=Cognatishimia sp. WU-CL00825 TaxID=3127658 RepID=UPI003104983C
MFDVASPFFLPVWRRQLVVAIVVSWGLFELATGATIWGMIFLGMGGIAAFKFWTADWSAVAEEDEEA